MPSKKKKQKEKNTKVQTARMSGSDSPSASAIMRYCNALFHTVFFIFFFPFIMFYSIYFLYQVQWHSTQTSLYERWSGVLSIAVVVGDSRKVRLPKSRRLHRSCRRVMYNLWLCTENRYRLFNRRLLKGEYLTKDFLNHKSWFSIEKLPHLKLLQ